MKTLMIASLVLSLPASVLIAEVTESPWWLEAGAVTVLGGLLCYIVIYRDPIREKDWRDHQERVAQKFVMQLDEMRKSRLEELKMITQLLGKKNE